MLRLLPAVGVRGSVRGFTVLSSAPPSRRQRRARLRQHTNPLRGELMRPCDPPVWEEVFEDPTLPVHLDIGCAFGELIRELAAGNKARNYIGVDVRTATIRHATASAEAAALRNVLFVTTNVHASLGSLLGTLPAGVEVDTVSILHPDPWFKRRHEKRRVVTTEFMDRLAAYLPPGAAVLAQTDVEELYEDIVEKVAGCTFFDREEDPVGPAFSDTPTSREAIVLERGGSIHRLAYKRNGVSLP